MSTLELSLVIACLVCLVVILTRLWFTTAKIIRTQDALLLSRHPVAPLQPTTLATPGTEVEALPPVPTSRVQAEERLTTYLLDEFRRTGRPISRSEAEAQARVMMDQVVW